MATQKEIATWQQTGREQGATHMLVVRDVLEKQDYPVYVPPGREVAEIAQRYEKKLTNVVWCYPLSPNLSAILELDNAIG